MKTNKTKDSMLEYRLTDLLEMSYSKRKKVLDKVKRKLLSRPIKDMNLYPLSTFALEDTLVVIQDGHPKQIKELYLLDRDKESFQTFGI